MKIDNLPSICIRNIINYLDIKNLVKLSKVNKYLNYECKNYPLNSKKILMTLSYHDTVGMDIFPEALLYSLKHDNFLNPATGWKNMIFFMKLDMDNYEQKKILKNFVPSNIMISLTGFTPLQTENLHHSIEMLDCPWKVLNCPANISNNLKYLNMSEQFYIPGHIDFSGKNLEVLHMNMCMLHNLKFNFSKTLKVINIFGCTGIDNLKGFEYVEKLNMDYCDKIESIEPLKNIKELSMRHCSLIKDVSSLKNCEILDISYTNIKDISSLKNLRKVYMTGIDKITFDVSRQDMIIL
jgi:hypothetical protein